MGTDDDRRRFEVVRGYVLLAVGVLLIVYSLVGTIEPAVLTLGGAMLGVDPVMRSAR